MTAQVFNVTHITSALSSTAAQDLVALLASSLSKVRLRKFAVSMRSSDVEDLQALGVELFRGSTSTPGSTSPLTPVNIEPHSGAPSAQSVVHRNSLTLMSTASAQRLWTGAMSDGFCYEPEYDLAPVIDTGQRLHARLTQPSAAGVFHIAMTFDEIGKAR